jgi:HK97 family phage portal protein
MPNFIQRLFKRSPAPQQVERVEVMSGGPAYFSPFSGDAYESDIYRAAVDAIARNCAKLKPTHVVTLDKQRKEGDPQLNRILQVRPNPYMSAFDMLYKLVTHYYLYNNAFAYLQKDERGNLMGIWPIGAQSMEFVTDPTGVLYCRFLFAGGQDVTLPYSDIVHLRRNFNSNDLLGDPNTAILPTLDLAHTQSQGIEAAIKSSAVIRGILKYNQVLSPEKLKQEKEAFISDYLTITNAGGIAALDSKAEYTPLKNDSTYAIDEKQLQAIKTKVYDYLGISEKIVSSTYTEDEWSATYESVFEVFAVMASLEFTEKIFTPKEQIYGNSILFESGRLQFASNSTKTNILKELMPLGLFTINQGLEILNQPTTEDGNRRLQTLNVVDASLASQYQLPDKGATA